MFTRCTPFFFARLENENDGSDGAWARAAPQRTRRPSRHVRQGNVTRSAHLARLSAICENHSGPGDGYRGPAAWRAACEVGGRLAPSTRPTSRSPQIRPCPLVPVAVNGVRESVAPVAEAVPLRVQHRTDGGDRHHERTLAVEENEELCHSSSSPPSPLEPEVLQRLGCAPVEHRSLAIVATASSKIALRNPRRSPMGA